MKLNAWNMSDGTVQIHKVGCAHKAGSGASAGKVQDKVEHGETDWSSKFEFAHDYWNNGILDEHEAEYGVGSFDVFAEMDFKPCTKSLPVKIEEETVVAVKPVKPATKTPAAKPAKAEKTAAVTAEPTACKCGCGAVTGKGSQFKQGHDARLVSKLVAKVDKADLTREDAIKTAKAISEPLAAKLGRALDNLQARLTKAHERAVAATKAKEAKAAAKLAKDLAAKEAAAKSVKVDELVADADASGALYMADDF